MLTRKVELFINLLRNDMTKSFERGIKYPSVAVIVLNYNGKSLVDESLGSLLRQKYPNYQIYLADDASTDNSVEYVRRKYPKVKIIKSSRNLGPAGISNYAVARTRENYVVLMSEDMKFDKNCVSELMRGITSDSSVGICTSVLVRHDKDPNTGIYYIDNAGGELDMYGFGMQHDPWKPFDKYPKEIQEVFFSYGGSFIISRELFNEAGGFDGKFWGLSDDIDLSWRVRLLGYKIIANPRSFLYHHISPSLGKLGKVRTRYLSERNSLRMLIKNYALETLFWVLPRYLVLELGEMLYFLIKRRPDLSYSVLSAVSWNLHTFPDTLRERRRIQASRVVYDEEIVKLLSKKSYKLKIFSAANSYVDAK
ncbi:MAG: Glycosyl transferase family 2 [Microgenomates group bacterium GW2011_GWA2_44_7]|nr:MAG: Glycosyl transferase family 2 [Microgenomates group bacterium GW2011_GWA2_44_7]KKT78392.1 MAG: Glycosyl transferase family 2 [Microgenomates group bacterium GW2011_GWB1_44_8]